MFLAVFIVVVFYFIYFFLTRPFNYWKNIGVVQKPPIPIFGNCRKIFMVKQWMAQSLQELYTEFPNERFIGIYVSTNPVLLVRDPDLIKHMFVKDFQHFQDREQASGQSTENPLKQTLLLLTGERWKHLRHQLTPTFTAGKLKAMFHLITECGNQFCLLLNSVADSDKTIETRDVCSKYMTQLIASVAFGLETHSIDDSNSKFYKMSKQIFEPDHLGMLKFLIRWFLPYLGEFINLRKVPASFETFMIGVVKDVIDYRKKNNVKRDDFMQLLLKLQQENSNDAMFKYNDELLAAQAFTFISAGFEASSGAMSYVLYELSLNPDIQTRVHGEIDRVLKKYGETFTYEGIQELTYLEKVFYEALRRYPPIGSLIRRCTIPYTIPGTTVNIPAGNLVQFPVYAIHHDPKYFPDPYRFNPERFSKENIKTRHPFSFLPFGEGPRGCIGKRFGKLQTMAGLASVLAKFTFTPSEKTEIPLTFSGKSFISKPANGIWLNVKHRENL